MEELDQQAAPDPVGDSTLLQTQLDALRETVVALERQIARAGREQLKANALAETQAERLATALDALRVADERRSAELAELRERLRTATATARIEQARGFLPALDGLDAAMRSGAELLAYAEVEDAPEAEPGPSWLPAWLRPAPSPPAPDPESDELRAAVSAWIEGLGFVRERMLAALAEADVRPIPTEGYRFDPRYHVAVEVVPADALPPGSVAYEIRRGYLAGERVLRHAEVAVARAAASEETP